MRQRSSAETITGLPVGLVLAAFFAAAFFGVLRFLAALVFLTAGDVDLPLFVVVFIAAGSFYSSLLSSNGAVYPM